MKNPRFTSPTAGEIRLEEIVDQISRAVRDEPDGYQIIVGTDSKTHSMTISYVSVIILYRIGRGGVYFYTRKRSKIGKHSFKARIFQEVSLSLSTAALLEDSLRDRGVNLPEIQCHSDIGNNGKTKTLIREVVSWIAASGYTPHIKPTSFGATSVADRHTD